MIIFDANNAKSFEDIDDWITQLRDLNDSAKLIIIANKNDLEWSTLKEDALEKAKEYNAKYIEVSVLKDLYIEPAAKKNNQMLEKKKKNIYSKAINIYFFSSLIVPKNSRAEKINS